MKRGIQWVAVIAIAAVAGCSSNGTGEVEVADTGPREFPEVAVRELAAQIEQAVAQGNREADIIPPAGLTLGTDQIRQSIRTRAARREVIDDFLDTGHAAEKQDGMIHVLRTKEYKTFGNRRTRDRNALLVISENRDRWTLYEGLVDENRMPRGSLDRLRQIFAEARIVTLQTGQRYENREGEIVVR